MLRMSADGKEGVAFGLYTMTGRAVSSLAPLMFSAFIAVFGTDRAGMGGLLLVLAAGFTVMLAVRVPRGRSRRLTGRGCRSSGPRRCAAVPARR